MKTQNVGWCRVPAFKYSMGLPVAKYFVVFYLVRLHTDMWL